MKKERTMRIIHLSAALLLTAALAVSLGVFAARQSGYASEIGALYDAAYYASLDNLGDIENKLKKLEVASARALQRELLEGVYTSASVAVGDIATLSGKNDEIEPALKFVNQLGDYCYFLARKVEAEGLSAEESEKLKSFSDIVEKLCDAFNAAGEDVAAGGNIYNAVGEGVNALTGIHELIGAGNVEYPELIYDGPFSDGLNDRESKFLADKSELTREAAEAVAEEKFGGDFTYTGDGTLGMETYVFVSGERSVQITKKGGYVAEYTDNSPTSGEISKDLDDLTASAAALLNSLGYENMKAVWASEQADAVYINFAYSENDIVYYPDLVKVKISGSAAAVTGVEAMNYIYNHTERETFVYADPEGISTMDGFERETLVRCVIPTEWNTELPAYEISGLYDGNTYYVYYDAESLEQIRVMRVIRDGNEGNLIV